MRPHIGRVWPAKPMPRKLWMSQWTLAQVKYVSMVRRHVLSNIICANPFMTGVILRVWSQNVNKNRAVCDAYMALVSSISHWYLIETFRRLCC